MQEDTKIYLIYTVGIHSSGKTYWANEIIKNRSKYVRVSREEIRANLNSKEDENLDILAKSIAFNTIVFSLIAGYSVIVDDCNLENEDNDSTEIKKLVGVYNIKPRVIRRYFTNVDIGEIWGYNFIRNDSKKIEVIQDQYDKYILGSDKYTNINNKMKSVKNE